MTVPMLETVRKRLRDRVRLIDKAHRKPIYTYWADTAGDPTTFALPGFGTAAGEFEQFRQTARAFLRQHTGAASLDKLKRSERLTPAELESLLDRCGHAEAVARAKADGHGLGLFVRSLVGLDREAAKRASGGFLAGAALSADQIEFVNLVIDYPAEHGQMDPVALYDSPFTDLAPSGPDGLITVGQLVELRAVLEQIQGSALAAYLGVYGQWQGSRPPALLP